MTAAQTLSHYGYSVFKKCSVCGGTLTLKYRRNTDWSCHVWHYPRKGQVRIMAHDVWKGVFPESQLTEKLHEFGMV